MIEGWHIAVILAVLTHGAATIWWGSKINATIGFIGVQIADIRKQIDQDGGKIEKEIDALWRETDKTRHDVDNLKFIAQGGKLHEETDA